MENKEFGDSVEFITQPQEEKKDSESECMLVNDKLEQPKEKCCILQKYAMLKIENYEKMLERESTHALEMNKFRQNCNELFILLEEIKSKRCNDSFTESDEKLGLQKRVEMCYLKSQKEKLFKPLIESINKNEDLGNNLSKLSKQLIALEKYFELLQDFNEKTAKDILHFKDCPEDNEEDNIFATQNMAQLISKIFLKEEDRRTLQNSLSKVKEILARHKLTNVILKDDFEILQDNERKTEKSALHEELIKETSALQNLFEEIIEGYKKRKFQMEALSNFLEKLKALLEENLRNLTNICGFDENLSIVSLKLILKNLESKNFENFELYDLAMINMLHGISNATGSVMPKLFSEFSEKFVLVQHLKERVEEKVSERKFEIDALRKKILDIKFTIFELEKLRAEITEEEMKISNSEERRNEIIALNQQRYEEIGFDNKKMDDVIKELKAHHKKMRGDAEDNLDQFQYLEDMQDSIVKMSIALNEEDDDNEDVQNFVKQTILERTYLEKMNELNESIQKSESEMEKLTTDLKIIEDNINLKKLQLEDFDLLSATIVKNHNAKRADITKKIDLLEITRNNLNLQLEGANEEKNKLEHELALKNESNDNLESEKEMYLQEFSKLKSEMLDLSEMIQNYEADSADTDEVSSNSSVEFLNVKLEMENKSKEIKVLEQRVEILNEKKAETEIVLAEMKVQNDALEEKVSAMNTEYELLKKLKADLENKCLELENNVSTIFVRMDTKKIEINDNITELLVYKETVENQISSLQKTVEDLKNQLDFTIEEKKSGDVYEMKIKELDLELSNLNMKINDVRREEVENIQEFEMIIEKIFEAILMYVEGFETEKRVEKDKETAIENLTEELHVMTRKCSTFTTEYNEKEEEVNEIKASLNLARAEKSVLEIKIFDRKKQYEEDFLAVSALYNIEYENLNQKEQKYRFNLERLYEQLENECSNKQIIEMLITKTKENLKILESEKSDIITIIESLTQSNEQYKQDSKDLQIDHENFLEESQLNLSIIQSELLEEIDNLKTEIINIEKKIDELRNEVKKIKEELELAKSNYENYISKEETKIQTMEENLKSLENKYFAIKFEQQKLIEVINENKSIYENLKIQNEEEKMKKLQRKISNLNCAYDIMQTGREKLSNQHDELFEEYNSLQISKKKLEIQLLDEISNFENKLKDTEEDLLKQNEELKSKENFLENIKTEMIALDNIIELRAAIHEVSDASSQNHLYVIQEDNYEIIKERLENFNLVKEKYNQSCKGMKDYQDEYETSEKKLCELNKLKIESEEKIKELENKIEEHVKKFNLISESLNEKEIIIAELQNNIEEKLQILGKLAEEKNSLSKFLQTTKKELESVIQIRDKAKDKNERLLAETEKKLMKSHNNIIYTKNDLLHQYVSSAKENVNLQKDKETLENLLEKEKQSKEFFEIRFLELSNQKNHLGRVSKKLKESITQFSKLMDEKQIEDIDDVDDFVRNIESRIVEIFSKIRQSNEAIKNLEIEKREIGWKIDELKMCKEDWNEEKEILLETFDNLQKNLSSNAKKDEQTKCLKNIKMDYELLKQRYDEAITKHDSKFKIEDQNFRFQGIKLFENYQLFLTESHIIKKDIDKMINDREILETFVTTLKENHMDLLIKSVYVTEDMHRLYFEQKNDLGVIINDIIQQFNRTSVVVYSITRNFAEIFEENVKEIQPNVPLKWQKLFEELKVNETLEKLEDLKDNTKNTIEELEAFSKSLEVLHSKGELKPRDLKENIASDQKAKENDWKKKYLNIKKRYAIANNTKNNYKKKIKELRDENKILFSQNMPKIQEKLEESEIAREHLMQQHNHSTKEYERMIEEMDAKYKIVLNKCDNYSEVMENNVRLKSELDQLKEANSRLQSDYSTIHMTNEALGKILQERNEQLLYLISMIEAYKRAFEENDNLQLAIDTIKYEENCDEYLQLSKITKEEGSAKLEEIEDEHEQEFAEDKMIKLHKFDKQIEKSAREPNQNDDLEDKSDESKPPKEDVEAKEMITLYQSTRIDEFSDSHESIGTEDKIELYEFGTQELEQTIAPTSSIDVNKANNIEEVVSLTLEGVGDVENEAEQSNDENVVDLIEDPSVPQTTENLNSQRISELARRNTMCPPHLQSSYATETQFVTPTTYETDDMKCDQSDDRTALFLPYDQPKEKTDPPTQSNVHHQSEERREIESPEIRSPRSSYFCRCYKCSICLRGREICKYCSRVKPRDGCCCYRNVISSNLLELTKDALCIFVILACSIFIASIK